MTFLKQLHDLGVRNIEMECTGFAALTHKVKVKGMSSVVVAELKVRREKLYSRYLSISSSYNNNNNNNSKNNCSR